MKIYECKYCDYATKTMQLMINHNLYEHKLNIMATKKKTVTKRATKTSYQINVPTTTEDIDIPHLRGGDWKWNFEKKSIPLSDKITWVCTVVNVAILISLVIKNV